MFGKLVPKGIVGALVLLLVAAWVARTVYDLLVPLLPSLLVMLGLVLLLSFLARARRS